MNVEELLRSLAAAERARNELQQEILYLRTKVQLLSALAELRKKGKADPEQEVQILQDILELESSRT